MEPVGEGAIRVTTGLESDISMGPGVGAAPLSMRRKAADSLAALGHEIVAQARRWTLWAPVAFGLGAAGYMMLRVEPPLLLAAGLAGAALAMVMGLRRWSGAAGLMALALLLAFAAAGFLSGKIRMLRVAAPVAPAEQAVRTVEGWVVDVPSPGVSGTRLLIAPVYVSGLASEETPARVRVTLRGDGPPPAPGSPIRLRAMIGPPPAPASPGAYDFARDAFFNRVGGVGFSLGEPGATALPRAPWRLRLAMTINAVRWSLAERIVTRLGPEQGGIAAAMVTGHEAWISAEQTEAMRASGLAHILSISGLHGHRRRFRVRRRADPDRAVAVAGPARQRQEGRRHRRPRRHRRLSGDQRRTAAGRAGGDHLRRRLSRHPRRPPGDQPAGAGRRRAGDPRRAAGGRLLAGLPDVVRRDHGAGRAGRSLAAGGEGDRGAVVDPRAAGRRAVAVGGAGGQLRGGPRHRAVRDAPLQPRRQLRPHR